MSICAPCTALKIITLCTDFLEIGEAPLANTPYVVYFKSLANGAIYSYQVTSDASKIITLEFTDGFPIADGMMYEMWINAAGDSIETKKNLIISGETHTCYNLIGNKVYDVYYGSFENFSTQTLEVAE